jgi:hypothetical protein
VRHAIAFVVACAIVASCQAGGHRSSAPSSTSLASSTTVRTPVTAVASDGTPAAAQEDAAARQWIATHHGRALDLRGVDQVGITADAIYALVASDGSGHASSLARLDRATGRVTTTLKLAATTADLTVRDGAVYLSAANIAPNGTVSDSALRRLDPVTLRTRWSIPAIGAIVPTDDAIWSVDDDRLQRRDPRSGALVATVQLPARAKGAGASIAIDPTDTRLWVTYLGDPEATIEVRNARSGALIRRVAEPSVAVGTGTLTPTATGVWLAGRGGMQGSAVFYALPDLRRAAALPDGYTMGVGLTWTGGPLWVQTDGFVTCADPRTGQYLDRPESPGSVALAQGPWSIFSMAAVDTNEVVLSVGGRLASFTPRDLCPRGGA